MKINILTENTNHLSDISKKKEYLLQSRDIPYSPNIHHDLEMASTNVNCIRDISNCNDVSLHSHNFHELLLIENGEIQYLLGEDIYSLKRGNVVIIPAGINHRPIIPTNYAGTYSRIALWISTDFLANVFETWPILNGNTKILLPRVIDISSSQYEHLWKYFETSVVESSIFNEYTDAFLAGNVVCLFAKATAAYLRDTVPPMAEKTELLSNIISYIELHYMEKITVNDMVKHFCISKSTLSKLFQDKLQVSFYAYVTQRRLVESKLLLQHGIELNEIANMVGFSDYSNFYRAFKREYGLSPSQYRFTILKK